MTANRHRLAIGAEGHGCHSAIEADLDFSASQIDDRTGPHSGKEISLLIKQDTPGLITGIEGLKFIARARVP